MKCLNCEKEFEVPKTHGGQNRIFCFECFPSGLTKTDGNATRYSLHIQMSNRIKLEKGCCKCGYKKNPAVLEWHHEGNDKINNPGNLVKYSWSRYLEEIDKCILVCANCHRELHNPY